MNTVNRTLAGVAFGTATSLVIITGLSTFGSRGVQTAEASVIREPETVPRRNRVKSLKLEEPAQAQDKKTLASITPTDDVIAAEDCTHLYYVQEGKTRRNFLKKVPCEEGQSMLMPVAIKDLEQLKDAQKGMEIVRQLLSSLAGKRCDPTKSGCTKKPHHGWDIRAKEGTPVLAPFSGEILDVAEDTDCGKKVKIDFSSGSGAIVGTFCHLSSWRNDLRPGKLVKRGEVIAYSGATGNATRKEDGVWKSYPHVHLQMVMKTLPKGCRIVPGGDTVDPFCFSWDFKYSPENQITRLFR